MPGVLQGRAPYRHGGIEANGRTGPPRNGLVVREFVTASWCPVCHRFTPILMRTYVPAASNNVPAQASLYSCPNRVLCKPSLWCYGRVTGSRRKASSPSPRSDEKLARATRSFHARTFCVASIIFRVLTLLRKTERRAE